MKNIIYIFADQWRKKAIGFENEPCITPNMDIFVSQSMVFNNAISTYPLCTPHRGALLTGKYPYTLGLWTNCKVGLDEMVNLRPQETSIGDVLKSNNYQTGYIGKWHLDVAELNLSDKPKTGCVGWDAYTPPGERRQGFDFWYSYGAMNNHLHPHYWSDSNKKEIIDQWSVEHETDVALKFLDERNKEQSFCLFISWNPPHPPFDQVPEKYVKDIDEKLLSQNIPAHLLKDENYRRKVREYYGAVNGMDVEFGRIYDYLINNDLFEDTILVLSADHGEMLGSHGRSGKNIWFEESINIPFIIGGGGISSGQSDALLGSVDHMPTLLDLVDVEIPETVHGKSFKSSINMKNDLEKFKCKSDVVEEEQTFIMMIPGMPGLIEPYRERGLNNKAFGWRGLRTKTHTYVVDNGLHPDEEQVRLIYDLVNDPLQMKPEFVTKDDDRVLNFDKKLKQYLAKTKDPFWLDRPTKRNLDGIFKSYNKRLQP